MDMSHSLVEIERSDWAQLRDLYVHKRTESVGYQCLKNFISWIDQEPSESIKLLSLDGDWKTDGTFIIVANIGGCLKHVYFNTLTENLERLKIALNCLEGKSGDYLLFGYSAHLIPALENFAKRLTGKPLLPGEQEETVWYHASKKLVDSFTINVPEGIKLADLVIENAEQINEIWPHRAPGSVDFVRRLILYNVSVGAFDGAGNLIAWCLRLPLGSLGLLHVTDGQKRKGLGSLLVRYMSKKLAELGDEALAPVVVKNVASRSMFEKLGFRQIDSVYWSAV
ncbi:uncharacterized protein LOC115630678 [Scaptodrosophila lebanonensis]|uniref:Uncharacterized protein LOC115630678 n=1 Tax=Drosophila lebanonensis TaxID=7225 RepID=A0A6J2U3G7_DROLE|nr:uncharacterized protein LOC115630678 [Scaptodrosophila lebanonensis]